MYIQEKQILAEKALKLSGLIKQLAGTIPPYEIYQLRKRLNYSIESLFNFISLYPEPNSKIEKMKSMIKTKAFIEECKDYITLAGKLKYAPVDDTLTELSTLQELIEQHYGKVN